MLTDGPAFLCEYWLVMAAVTHIFVASICRFSFRDPCANRLDHPLLEMEGVCKKCGESPYLSCFLKEWWLMCCLFWEGVLQESKNKDLMTYLIIRLVSICSKHLLLID